MPTTTIPSRTWRLQAFTDYQSVPRIEFLRESITAYDDGGVIHKALPTVARTLAEIAATPIDGGPITCTTLGDLFNAVAAAGHQLAAVDDARAAADAAAAAAAVAEEAARRAAAESAAAAAADTHQEG